MLITKSNIMFSAWQRNDGHGSGLGMCICVYAYASYYALVDPISPSSDNYGFTKLRDQGAKSVDRNACDAA